MWTQKQTYTKERLCEETKRKCHKSIRVMLLSAKEHLRLSELEDTRKSPPLAPSEGPCPCWLFMWTSTPSRTMKQYISGVQCPLIYDTFLQQPWEINTGVPLEIIIIIITEFLMETAKFILLNIKVF